MAGSAVWLSFLLAGVVATLQGYAVAKLGARYPSYPGGDVNPAPGDEVEPVGVLHTH